MMRIKKLNDSFKRLYAFGAKFPMDLSLSENPMGCSPSVKKLLKKKKTDVFEYPESGSGELKLAISKKFGLESKAIFVANGSEMIINLLPQAILTEKDEVIIPKITFPMFGIAVRLAGNKVLFSKMSSNFDIEMADIESKITSKTKLIFLCNPNNPTGRILEKEAVVNLVSSAKAFVVVDEANIEFGGDSVANKVKSLDNLIVLRTMSKGFGLAGLRVGFCLANPKIIKNLEDVSSVFPVSSISQQAAIVALRDKSFIKKTKQVMNRERKFLTKELGKRGLLVIDSSANNLLVQVGDLFDSSERFLKLLNKHGATVVDGAGFGLKEFVRISPRLRKTNQAFLDVIDKIL